MKGMILAAGMGTRLLPFTRFIPKPLLPVGDRRSIEYPLELLVHAGVKEVAVNLHHLPDLLRDFLTGHARRVKIHYSFEPRILGTGGGVKKARDFFGESAFFLLNSDVVADMDLRDMARFHRERGGVATMVLKEFEEGEEDYPAVITEKDGRVIDIAGLAARVEEGPWRRGLFTGVHLLESRLLDYLPQGESCIIRQGYIPALKEGEAVYGYFLHGFWQEVSTKGGYFRANREILQRSRRGDLRVLEPVRLSSPEPSRGLKLVQPAVIGRGVKMGDGVKVGPWVVIGDGASLGKGCIVSTSIVLPGSEVPPALELSGSIFLSRAGEFLKEGVT